MEDDKKLSDLSEEEKAQKVQSLREMVSSAERTIQGAKAMLLQLEGKKKSGRPRKLESSDDGRVVEGTFDGQVMTGTDGKQYPVPANYASKSKLVEGDHLKLTINLDGSFIYKQIGPAPRTNVIGIVNQDENGNYFVIAEGRPYKILLASVTYFKVEPGDEVVIVTAQENSAEWAAIENVLQKAKETPTTLSAEETEQPKKKRGRKPKTATGILTKDEKESVVDEWTPDINEIEKEIKQEMAPKE